MEHTNERTPRIRQIDALKGIAIFLVVLGHSIIVYPVNLMQDPVCAFIFNMLSSVHMPLFFTVSGYCFSYKENYGVYIRKKVKRLLVPYVAFTLVNIVPRYVFSSLVNNNRDIGQSLFKMFFSGGEYWFLYTLFIIFLVFPAVYNMAGKKLQVYIPIMAASIVLYHVLPEIKLLTLSRFLRYLPFFMLGVLLKEYAGRRLFAGEFGLRSAVTAAALTVLWSGLILADFEYPVFILGLIGIMVCRLLVRSEFTVRVFERFGNFSLQLYLLNGYLLVISRTLTVTILGVSSPFIIIVFNMLIDFFVSYLIIKYICSRVGILRTLMGIV